MGTKSIKKKFSFLLLNLSLIVPLSGCNFTIEPNISKPSNTTSEDISADERIFLLLHVHSCRGTQSITEVL